MALITAGVFHFFCAIIALNKQQMTSLISTIGMAVKGVSALVTIRNNIIANALTSPVIKHKVFS
jgi:FtsH-binding integral membrane protein